MIEFTCGSPDTPDEAIAKSSPDDIARDRGISREDAAMMVEAHRRKAAYENQKWPANCHADMVQKYGNGHVVKLYVEWERFPQQNMRPCTDDEFDGIVRTGVWGFGTVRELRDKFGDTAMAKVALWFALESYRRVGIHHEEIDDGPNGSEHQIHIIAKNIPGSTIGVGWFPDGTCRDHVNQHIDTIRFGLHSLARLFAHELGHNHGEEHEFRNQGSHYSVMSYTAPRDGLFYGFSTGRPPYPAWLPQDRSLPSLIEKYGGSYFPESSPEPEPPVDPEPPTEPEEPVEGIFEIVINIVMEVIKDCIENRGRSREDVGGMVQRKGIAVRWEIRKAVNRAARQQGLSRSERREAHREAQQVLDSMAVESIDDLIDDALAS